MPPYRHTRHLEACQQNLGKLGTALEMYSSDNGGRFPFGPGSTWGRSPRALSRLVGKYIDRIPTCPAAGRDTYSESYTVGYRPDALTVFCRGSAHPGLEADFPRYESWCGLTLESPDRVWPMGGTLPAGVELDGVAMVTIMEQKQLRLAMAEQQQRAMAEQWRRAMAEHRVPPQMAEPYSERADATGKTVTSLKGSFCEGDPASRVLEVLGTPTGRTQNGFEETSLIYVDKATSNTLTIYLAKGKVRGEVRLERPWVSPGTHSPPSARPTQQTSERWTRGRRRR